MTTRVEFKLNSRTRYAGWWRFAGHGSKNPPHPGGFVRTEIIEPTGLSITAAAVVLGVTRPALSSLLNERSSLSPDMALRIEKAFGVSMETLMRMQGSFDIAQVRKRQDDVHVMRYQVRPSPGGAIH